MSASKLNLQRDSTVRLSSPPPIVAIPTKDPFDETIGLWRQSAPGHTASVAKLPFTHSARSAAQRLFQLAYWRSLDPEQGTKVLKAIRRLQTVDGSAQHGGLRWYHEEPKIEDTNAAFFIGMNLIALDRSASASLNDEGREVLATIFQDLSIWFNHEAEGRLAKQHYPNKFMGDLVCAWLIQETVDPNTPEAKRLLEIMRETANYWKSEHWGWGEHLSDIYANVLLNQLSCLLLFSRHLPEDVRKQYQALMNELLAIEDQYANGPRVPVIRSYSGDKLITIASFRSTVREWTEAEVSKSKHQPVFPFGDLFARLSWAKIAPPPTEQKERVEVPCFKNSLARAWVTPAVRFGTMSRYPIMPHTDAQTWGLSWQSMPVAFAAGKNGWGYLRWHAREDGVDRFHPAANHKAGYLSNSLSPKINPPIVGQTYSLQEGPDALILRRMPRLAPGWENLSDQLVLTGEELKVETSDSGPGWTQLRLKAGESFATVFYFPLGLDQPLKEETASPIPHWTATLSAAELAGRDSFAGIWIFCWEREVKMPPIPRPLDGDQWEVTWPTREGDRRVIYAPTAADPLRLE